MRNNKNVMPQKPKNFKKGMGKILRYLNNLYIPILIALVFVIAGTVIEVIGPDKIKLLTNEIVKLLIPGTNVTDTMASVLSIVILLVVLYLLSMLFNIIQSYIMAIVTEKTSFRLRKDISKKINLVPLKYFDSSSTGDVISRVTNDVDTISQTLNQSIATLIKSVVMILGSVLMMFITSPLLAVTAIAASLIGFVLIGVIMSNSQKFFISQQTDLGKMNGFIEESYTNHNVIKAYNAKDSFKEGFEKINTDLHSSAWKSQFFSGLMMPLMSFIGNFGYVCVIVVGSILVNKGKTDIGTIMAFTIYIRLFNQPLTQLAQVANNFQRTAAASERVFEFLEEEELSNEEDKTLEITETKGLVEFENVKFGYVEDKTIINDFTAYAKAGSKVAIVGPTGAGKTTIVNLLMRFYELNSGSIKIDGINISDVKRENVHDQFCMVLQDTWLFEGTIFENIAYSMDNVTKEDVKLACKKIGLHHFIKTLPNGYDTVLTEKSSVSEGQKQLITIARAMIKDAPLLILDEATSSVDTRTEKIIQEAMDELMKGRTSFIIAHRLSTIKNADLILVMDNGDIIEKGNHESLIKKDGFYAKLYNSQFEM